jgi:L-alanine-DL-glutamate epimerase-like enolase superfamily enzyme
MQCAPISTRKMIMNMMCQAAPSSNTGQCDAAVIQMSKLFAGVANARELAEQVHVNAVELGPVVELPAICTACMCVHAQQR